MQQPEETIEGWYCLHLFWRMDWPAFGRQSLNERRGQVAQLGRMVDEFDANARSGHGSSYLFNVLGDKADLGLMLYRETLDELSEIENRLAKMPLFAFMHKVRSFVSVGEVGTYSGRPKTDRGWAYVRRSVRPQLPARPYICFYPMSKTRIPGANWYDLPYEQRQAYMKDHGMIGRQYAGKVVPLITGAMGFDDYEWGVTLFADDPLAFKKIVQQMRYAEASAIYGEFPYFIIGRHLGRDGFDHFFLDPWDVDGAPVVDAGSGTSANAGIVGESDGKRDDE